MVEIPLKKASYGAGTSELSFFDTTHAEGAKPFYYLANHATSEASYRIQAGTGQPGQQVALKVLEGVLPAGRQLVLTDLLEDWKRGWILLEHLGPPENLVLHGYLLGRNHLSAVPVVNPGELTRDYQVLRLPSSDRASGSFIMLFHPSRTALDRTGDLKVSIELIGSRRESLVARRQLILREGEIRSFAIDSLFPLSHGDGNRLRVAANGPLAVSGVHRDSRSNWSELSFFAEASGHDTGNYPLLDTSRHRVFTTLLNVGAEEASAVFQIYWPQGSYSFGPIPIPPGESRRVDVQDLLQSNEPDLLGRTLPERIESGLIRWTSVGPASIVARTEALDLTTGDVVGFNCKSCCEQIPVAAIIPEIVEFVAGGSASYQSSYYYTTCDGQMGPFPIPPQVKHVPAPFSWDGTTLAANEAADKDIGFEAEVFGRSPFCFSFWRWIQKWGKGLLCKKTFLDPWSNSIACNQQTSNGQSCLVCCTAQKTYRLCRGLHPALAEGEYNACVGLCIE